MAPYETSYENPEVNAILGALSDDALTAEICRRSYYEFFREFWHVVSPEKLVDNWHIKQLCDELQFAAERVIARKPKLHDLIINVPPGSSKSTICTILFHPWCWAKDPTLKIISSSYSASLSVSQSVKSRDVITSELYQRYFPYVVLKEDANNKTEYATTKGGVRFTTSTGGTVTGNHGHIIIWDDPLNPEQAVSDAERESANRFIGTTLSSRKVDKSITLTIGVMQRLHEMDPTGMLLEKKSETIRHLCLPSELSERVSPPEWRQYYVNGLLDPVRLSADVLAEAKLDLGSYGYSGQHSQDPTPSKGGIWQRWIIPVPDNEFPTNLQNFGTDWDTAYTQDELNAASAFVVSGKYANRMYIDNLGYFYKEFPELIENIKSLPYPHYIEAKANGKSARQTLVRLGIAAVEVQVPGGADKIARARTATPFCESALVYCRSSLLEKLYADPKQGILRFPNGQGKDLADALAQAIIRHFHKQNKTGFVK